MPPGFPQCFGCNADLPLADLSAAQPAMTGPASDNSGFFGTTATATATAPTQAAPPTGPLPRGWAPPAPPGAHSGAGPAGRHAAAGTGRGSNLGVVAVVALVVLAVVGGAVYFVVNLGKGAGQTVSAAGALLDKGPKGALERQLQSDVANGASAEETYNASSGGYTTDVAALESNGLRVSAGDQFRVVSASAAQFCLASSRAGLPTAYWNSASGGISAAPCH